MTDEELQRRVGELATRIGHPIPAIEYADHVPDPVSCIYLRPGPMAPILVVHRGVEDKWPEVVQELAIAQEFVSSRLGYGRRAQLVRHAVTAALLLVAFLAVVTVGNWVEPLWLAIAVAIPIAYVPGIVVWCAIMAGWNRWAIRRIDRELVRVLGRDRIVAALGPEAAERVPLLRRLRLGLAPSARQRLRWIG